MSHAPPRRRSRARPWPRLMLLIPVLVALGAACGVPTDSAARPVTDEEQLPAVTNATEPMGPTARTVDLFFVDGDQLTVVARAVEEEPSIALAIDQLLAGVTQAEKDAGLLSAIPPDTTALGSDINGTLLTLDLSEQFVPVGELYVRAVAQIVFTATSSGRVTRVRLLVNGTPINPPTVDNGNLPEVMRHHYLQLAPDA